MTHRRWLIAVLAVLSSSAFLAGSYLWTSTVVELRADGEVSTTILARGLAVTVHRAVTVELTIDDRADLLALDGDRFTVTTVAATFAEVLAASPAADAVHLDARFSPELDQPVADRAALAVEVAVPVTVQAEGRRRASTTYARDIAGVLSDVGIEIGPDDRVTPPLDSPLTGRAEVTVARVEIVEEVVEVALAHDSVDRDSDTLAAGQRQVETEGRDGLRLDTYEVILVDGVEESRTLLGEEVVREPPDTIVLVGTAEPATRPAPPVVAAPPSAGTNPPPGDGAVVHLTYDDGPHPVYTPQLLDLLAAYDARATFFVLGQYVPRHPAIATRIVREGHAIGNHSWSHPYLTQVSDEVLARELRDTQSVVQRTTGVTPRCLRPPYGDHDAAVEARAASLGLTITMWSFHAWDWDQPGTDAIVNDVLRQVRPGSVILLHDGPANRAQTVEATARILAELTDRGYRFTPVPGC